MNSPLGAAFRRWPFARFVAVRCAVWLAWMFVEMRGSLRWLWSTARSTMGGRRSLVDHRVLVRHRDLGRLDANPEPPDPTRCIPQPAARVLSLAQGRAARPRFHRSGRLHRNRRTHRGHPVPSSPNSSDTGPLRASVPDRSHLLCIAVGRGPSPTSRGAGPVRHAMNNLLSLPCFSCDTRAISLTAASCCLSRHGLDLNELNGEEFTWMRN